MVGEDFSHFSKGKIRIKIEMGREIAVAGGTDSKGKYRGRIAPTPSGYLHLGHARTFWQAQARATERNGQLILRVEDLDAARSQPRFLEAMLEDLRWFGLRWDEGPDIEGRSGPYQQSARFHRYRHALEQLIVLGRVYRCDCSRKDIQTASLAPHLGDEGPLYPGTCRKNTGKAPAEKQRKPNWRFRVPDNRQIAFEDGNLGNFSAVAGVHFGDFVVWRQDNTPAYQLAAVVDDHAMGITEVVRGEDLLLSTCRQLLLYKALNWSAPEFFHCPLMKDARGERLSKRNQSLALRSLREQGLTPEQARERHGIQPIRF